MGRIVLAVVLVATVFALPAQAAEPLIGIGEVTAQATSRDDVDVAALRTMVEEAVGTLDAARVPRGSGAILSVSLVRMESRASSPAEVTCLVSATLRDRGRGSVFAVLEGTARGQDEPRRMRALERSTLRAAVASAIARVPEAMRRRRR